MKNKTYRKNLKKAIMLGLLAGSVMAPSSNAGVYKKHSSSSNGLDFSVVKDAMRGGFLLPVDGKTDLKQYVTHDHFQAEKQKSNFYSNAEYDEAMRQVTNQLQMINEYYKDKKIEDGFVLLNHSLSEEADILAQREDFIAQQKTAKNQRFATKLANMLPTMFTAALKDANHKALTEYDEYLGTKGSKQSSPAKSSTASDKTFTKKIKNLLSSPFSFYYKIMD